MIEEELTNSGPLSQSTRKHSIYPLEYGEAVKAVVELVDSTASTDELESELRRYCEAHLARFKVPRSFDFPAKLPRTPLGKLAKRLLRDPYWQGQSRQISASLIAATIVETATDFATRGGRDAAAI